MAFEEQKKANSPLKKLIKRLNPKKKKMSKKRKSKNRDQGTEYQEKVKNTDKLEVSKTVTPAAAATAATTATPEKVEPAKPVVEERTKEIAIEITCTTNAGADGKSNVEDRKENGKEKENLKFLFRGAGIVCALVESIPLVTSVLTSNIFSGGKQKN